MSDTLPFPQGAKIVAYLRDSGGRDQDQSVAQQEKAVGEWCKTYGYILVRIFKDEARSGTRVRGRDAFVAMIDYFASDPDIAGLLLWDFSRFARDKIDAQYYMSGIRRRGYTIYSLKDDIPPGLDGAFLEDAKIYMNAKFIERLKIDIIRGQQYVIRNYHAYFNRNIPFGFKPEELVIGKRRGKDKSGNAIPHKITILVPDESKRSIVTDMFTMRAAGATFKEIHDKYHAFSTIHAYSKMLRSTRYIGEWNGVTDFNEPIIDATLFERVQDVNNARKARHTYNHPRVVRSRFFLSGLLYCARCGKPMYASTTKKRSGLILSYYRCSSQIIDYCGARGLPKNEIESLVLEVVITRVIQPDMLMELYKRYLNSLMNAASSVSQERDRLDVELRQVNKEISNILAAIRDIGHSPSMLAELSRLEDRKSEIATAIANLTVPAPREGLPNIQSIISRIAPVLRNGTGQDKVNVLRGLLVRVDAEKIDKKISGRLEFCLPDYGSAGGYVISL